MNPLYLSLSLAILLSLIGVAGDFFIKIAGNGKKFLEPKWFLAGLAIYVLAAFGWLIAMKNAKLSTLGVFYAIFTIIFVVSLSFFYFKEPLNVYEVAGIILALISLILLGRFS